MGNAKSCLPAMSRRRKAAVVVWWWEEGKSEAYRDGVTAAEITARHPNSFVCDAATLAVGHRIHGLAPHRQLDTGLFYLLLPLDLLFSVLTPQEMASFSSSSDHPQTHPHHNDHKSDELCSVIDTFYSDQRSWTPALETILESPPP